MPKNEIQNNECCKKTINIIIKKKPITSPFIHSTSPVLESVIRLKGFRRVAARELGGIIQQVRKILNRRLISEVVKYAKLCFHYIILDVVDDIIIY